jgi:probable rRNA maturation factor
MTLEIDNRQELYDINEMESIIELVVQNVFKCELIENECQVSIILVNNEQIREINKEYRRINSPTDVLSFPLIEYEKGSKFTGLENLENLDIDTGEIVLGDIVISMEKVHEQSIEYGHSMKREIAFLTVHGMLHLLGYDHEFEEDRKVMREKEEKILNLSSIER